MRKTFIFTALLVLTPFLIFGGTREDKRRIEEEGRQSLRSTEAGSYERQPISGRQEPTGPDYFQELLAKDYARHSDACMVLAVLLGADQGNTDFYSQVNYLKQQDIISEKTASQFRPDEPLRKGLAAHLFCRALKIKGGIWLRLFGESRRYALKELVFEGIVPGGNLNDIVSGEELVIILTRAADYAAEHSLFGLDE